MALEPHHVRLLTLAYEAYDSAQEARETVEREGKTYIDRSDQPKPRPEVAIQIHSERVESRKGRGRVIIARSLLSRRRLRLNELKPTRRRLAEAQKAAHQMLWSGRGRVSRAPPRSKWSSFTG